MNRKFISSKLYRQFQALANVLPQGLLMKKDGKAYTMETVDHLHSIREAYREKDKEGVIQYVADVRAAYERMKENLQKQNSTNPIT